MLDEAIAAMPRTAGASAKRAMGMPLPVAVAGEAISLQLERHQLPALKAVASSANLALAHEAMQKVKAGALLFTHSLPRRPGIIMSLDLKNIVIDLFKNFDKLDVEAISEKLS